MTQTTAATTPYRLSISIGTQAYRRYHGAKMIRQAVLLVMLVSLGSLAMVGCGDDSSADQTSGTSSGGSNVGGGSTARSGATGTSNGGTSSSVSGTGGSNTKSATSATSSASAGGNSATSSASAGGNSATSSTPAGGNSATSSTPAGSNSATSSTPAGGNSATSSAAKGGNAATGGNAAVGGSSTTAPVGTARGAASLTVTQTSGCTAVGSLEIPNVASGHAVTASGATQTLFHEQPIGTYYAEVVCSVIDTLASGKMMMLVQLASDTARITIGMDHIVVGQTSSAGMTLALGSRFSGNSPTETPCQLTPLQASDSSILAKLTCTVLDGGSGGGKCGLSESYIYFDNCTPPS